MKKGPNISAEIIDPLWVFLNSALDSTDNVQLKAREFPTSQGTTRQPLQLIN